MTIVERLVSVVAPYSCLVCGREDSLLCAWCRLDSILPPPEVCYRCHQLSSDSAVCPKCRSKSPLKYVWARTNYGGTAKELIHKLKFARAQAASQVIAELMSETLPYLPAGTIITHVPAATARVRLRGYDQARLLAKAIANRSSRRHFTLLARQSSARQVGANRAQRLEQLKGAFRTINQAIIRDTNILLVDDVLTTGATLEECAKTLKAAGAKTVNAVTFAR